MADRIKAGELPLFRGILAVVVLVFFSLLFAPPELVSKYDWLRQLVSGVRGLLHLE